MSKRTVIPLTIITAVRALMFLLLKDSVKHFPTGSRAPRSQPAAKPGNVSAVNSVGAPTGSGGAASAPDYADNRERQLLKTLHQRMAIQTVLNQQYLLGKSLFFQHKYAAAVKTENKVIQQSPLFYKAYNVRGIALCYAGKYQEGMNNIEKALAIAPNYDYAHFNKALALELYGHYNEALKAYHQTLPIASHNWKMWSYYGIAAIYGRRGDVPDTVKYLRKAIVMNPKHVRAVARTERDFDNVRRSPQFQQLVK